ncbi:uncharacterized protein ACWYII_024335 [Salvelinus alpinus]
MRTVSRPIIHRPVCSVPASRICRVEAGIQPERVGPDLRSRPPVRLHGPVYPVPRPRTRPPACLPSLVNPWHEASSEDPWHEASSEELWHEASNEGRQSGASSDALQSGASSDALQSGAARVPLLSGAARVALLSGAARVALLSGAARVALLSGAHCKGPRSRGAT